MAPLKLVGVAAALLAAMPAAAQTVDPVKRWRPLIAEASARFGIPIAWVERVMRVESAGRTSLDGRPTTSRAGAIGLMQLMPGTWADMRTALGLGADPHDPRDNIIAGTAYLQRLYRRFGYPGLFAAYNAGPARYAAYLAGKRALPAETRNYLESIGAQTVAAAQRPQQESVFAIRMGAASDTESPFRPAGDTLFAIRYSP
jgi:soluble lytic murein transglycosylase-like protein